jgi:hypothetical protein
MWDPGHILEFVLPHLYVNRKILCPSYAASISIGDVFFPSLYGMRKAVWRDSNLGGFRCPVETWFYNLVKWNKLEKEQ